MPRKKQHEQHAPYTIAIDIGYGYTQALDTRDGEMLQPSIYTVKPAAVAGDELDTAQAQFPALTLYEDDQTYLLGTMADVHTAHNDKIIKLSARENSATGNAARLRLVKMAAAQLNIGNTSGDVLHAQIVTGLPVDYLRDRTSLKNALTGQHRIQTDATDFILNVDTAMIMPQPLGTIYNYRLRDGGGTSNLNADTIVCFDFGTLTAQIATHTVRAAGGGFIPSQSFSVNAGAHIIRDALYEWLEIEFGSRDLPLSVIDAAIKTGTLKVKGEYFDVSNVISRAMGEIMMIIERKAAAQIGEALTADIVLVSGGIAPLAHDHIAERYGRATTFLADNPQWANVAGYRKFAEFKQQTTNS